MHLVAGESVKERGLGFGFNPFGDDPQLQRMCERDHRVDDVQAFFVSRAFYAALCVFVPLNLAILPAKFAGLA